MEGAGGDSTWKQTSNAGTAHHASWCDLSSRAASCDMAALPPVISM